MRRWENMKQETQINCYSTAPRTPHPDPDTRPAPQLRSASGDGCVRPLDGLIESTVSHCSGGRRHVLCPRNWGTQLLDSTLSLLPVQPEIFPPRPSQNCLPALGCLIAGCRCAIYPANGATFITSTSPYTGLTLGFLQ